MRLSGNKRRGRWNKRTGERNERGERGRERMREKKITWCTGGVSEVYSNPRITGEERRIGTRDWPNANC